MLLRNILSQHSQRVVLVFHNALDWLYKC